MEHMIENVKAMQYLRYVDVFFLLLSYAKANQHKNETRWLLLHKRS